MAEYRNIMVFGEVAGDGLAAITKELLGCGRKLADVLGEELSVVLMGNNLGSLARKAICFGADKVYVIDDPSLKGCLTDHYLMMMEKIIGQAKPRILILGQTDIGRDLACRLAFRLGTAATLDCLQLSIDPDSKLLLQTKPVYGGNALATYTCLSCPQIAAVRAKTMFPLKPDDSRQGEIIAIKADIDTSAVRTKILEKVLETTGGIRLEDAKVVVSGGRGMGGPAGFKRLEELAALLNGAVGATRSSCDHGWAPYKLQIGITGRIINPDLYIAVGISGASQHMTGLAGARTIVAINKDRGANIFKEARFGIVGDWQRALPAFIAKVRELTSIR